MRKPTGGYEAWSLVPHVSLHPEPLKQPVFGSERPEGSDLTDATKPLSRGF